LACGIDIKDEVAPTLPIPNPPDGSARPPFGKTLLLEELAKRFQARMIYARQEPAQAGAMRKVSTSKQGHERRTKGR
jgi:hypothetical protein